MENAQTGTPLIPVRRDTGRDRTIYADAMKSIRLSPTCIVSGPEVIGAEICVKGRWWRFDYSYYIGPLWLKKNGEARTCQNPNRAVWEEFIKWRALYEATGFGTGGS